MHAFLRKCSLRALIVRVAIMAFISYWRCCNSAEYSDAQGFSATLSGGIP